MNSYLLDSVILLDHFNGMPDALQAAVAINRQLMLATRNSKDFDPVRHAFVSIPYRLNEKQT